MIKTTGVEYKKFINDENFWIKESYIEDDCIEIDGIEVEDGDISTISDTSVVKIITGTIRINPDNDDSVSLLSFFKKWKKMQTVSYLVIEVKNEKLEQVKTIIENTGSKIIK